jgi:hypothetical protein
MSEASDFLLPLREKVAREGRMRGNLRPFRIPLASPSPADLRSAPSSAGGEGFGRIAS